MQQATSRCWTSFMRSNPRIKIHFIPTPRYMLRGDASYRVRRPVLVALCVATAFVVALGGTLALLWFVNR